ncbi:MAG: type II secretion system F family protein [Ardenticatenaceae bacterium]|nr:type II secretion system F family protein [Ardenticatenaceae bacterium]
MIEELDSLRMTVVILFGATAFFVMAAVLYWAGYSGLIRRALQRSREVGIDQDELNANRQGSLFLRWGNQYDQSEKAETIRQQLMAANLRLKPSEYMAVRFAAAAVVFIICNMIISLNYSVSILIGAAVAIFIPPIYLRSQRRRYISAFNFQLIEATSTMASAIRAGMSVPQAIEQVSRKVPAPAQQEFQKLSREVNLLGVSIEEGLQNALQRLPSDDLAVVIATLMIQRQSGGNLVDALSQLSDIMRSRAQLRDEVNTMTAEVRYSAYIVTLMPVIIVFFLRNIAPDLVNPLFESVFGWIILSIFVAVQIVAFLFIRRIADVRV